MNMPVLYVEIIPLKHIWTPVYAQAEYKVEVSYASNGDTSFRKDEVVRFTSDTNPITRQLKSSFTIQDTSFGIMSVTGYQDYLAEKMAAAIHENLRKEILN